MYLLYHHAAYRSEHQVWKDTDGQNGYAYDDDKRHGALVNLYDGYVGTYAAHHKNVQAHWRGNTSQHHHHGDECAEPDSVNAVQLGNGIHKRHGQNQNGRGFENAAQNQEKEEHHEQFADTGELPFSTYDPRD